MKNSFKRLPVIRSSATARQLMKFGMVGVTNTLWDFTTYLLMTRGWLGFRLPALLANGLSFFAAMTNSYILNKRWTFRDPSTRHHVQFTKFTIVNVVTLFLYEGLFYLFHTQIGLYDIIAKGLSIIIVLTWNYSANRFWTFRRESDIVLQNPQ